MSFGNILKYGAIGLAADLFAPAFTGGRGGFFGALAGLFTPNARDMAGAYQPNRFGLPSFDFLNTSSFTRGPLAMLAFGAASIFPALGNILNSPIGPFSLPGYMPSIWSTSLSPAGLLPMAWRSGLIRDWGATAGWLT
jgi:hypothetical protein